MLQMPKSQNSLINIVICIEHLEVLDSLANVDPLDGGLPPQLVHQEQLLLQTRHLGGVRKDSKKKSNNRKRERKKRLG